MKTRFALTPLLSGLALTGLFCACTPAQEKRAAPLIAEPEPALPLAQAVQVWIGGSRAWPDFVASGSADQWTFLRDNADGFYINNFAMRLTDKTLKLAPDLEGRLEQLRQMKSLMKSSKLFYETDEDHSSDKFDQEALDNFKKSGFDVAGVTINRGTNPGRTAILTDNGKRPLYYMFGPWRGGGDIANAENEQLRADILQLSGAAVDGPVTMWRKDAGKMKPMVYSTIRWSHDHSKKFLYLLAPNEAGPDFLAESKKLAHDLEDNDANPDIWAVAFYGPPSFRDKLAVLPEKDAGGQPAQTFSGAAYWLIHHLRDPNHALRLSVAQAGADDQQPIMLDLKKARKFVITLSNGSDWLDLAPVVRARVAGETPPGSTLRWKIGARDVTEQVHGEGLVFNRELRLQPGDHRALELEIEGDAAHVKLPVRVELMPHPSTPIVRQTLNLVLNGNG